MVAKSRPAGGLEAPAPLGRRVRVGLPLALGAALLGWLAWAAWCSARAGLLWGQVRGAVSAADWAQAEDALGRFAWYRPDDLESLRLRAEIALRRGDLAGASRALAAVPDSAPEAASARLRLGLIAKERYRLAEAEAAFRASLKLEPAAVEPRRELIALLGVERRGAEQREELWALHDRAGRKAEALRVLAQSVVTIPPGSLGRTSDEGAVLRRCLDTTPDDPRLPPPLARFHRLRGELDAALRLADPSRLDDPYRPEGGIEWLACMVERGDVEAARPRFETPPPAALGHADYWRLRGDWFNLQGRTADALASYRTAARLDPLNPENHYRLALALRASGQGEAAEAALGTHRQLRELAILAARVDALRPDPALLGQVGRLCATLSRDREARAWLALADGANAAPLSTPRGAPL